MCQITLIRLIAFDSFKFGTHRPLRNGFLCFDRGPVQNGPWGWIILRIIVES